MPLYNINSCRGKRLIFNKKAKANIEVFTRGRESGGRNSVKTNFKKIEKRKIKKRSQKREPVKLGGNVKVMLYDRRSLLIFIFGAFARWNEYQWCPKPVFFIRLSCLLHPHARGW